MKRKFIALWSMAKVPGLMAAGPSNGPNLMMVPRWWGRDSRPADGAISIAMDRRASDGAVVSTSFDVHMPQRGAGVFHLALASLPVSTIVSLKLRVGDQSPLR